MISVAAFIISGLAIVLLIAAKKLEEKQKKPSFILNRLSKSNIYLRELYLGVIHFYSESKERISFFFQKQIPMHSRNFLNKLVSFLKERREQYMGRMRDSRLLKKSDGISEFFKNMSNIEKGNGEINDVYEDSSQDDKKELE